MYPKDEAGYFNLFSMHLFIYYKHPGAVDFVG